MLLGNRPISKLGYSSHSVELVIQFKKKKKGGRIEPHFCSSAQNEVLVARGVVQPPATQPAQVGLKEEFLSTGALASFWPPAASASSWGFSARPSRPRCPSSPIVISASS